MDINIVTTAQTDEEARELLKLMGRSVPFIVKKGGFNMARKAMGFKTTETT